jgi:LuxR family quorum sensing-dependent transcriptional regulator
MKRDRRLETIRAPRPSEHRDNVVLTPRLAEILPLVADGKTDREIGIIIGISLSGADMLLRRLRQVFGVSTRSQVVAEAFRRGLVK